VEAEVDVRGERVDERGGQTDAEQERGESQRKDHRQDALRRRGFVRCVGGSHFNSVTGAKATTIILESIGYNGDAVAAR
jgi:hypothetical protein